MEQKGSSVGGWVGGGGTGINGAEETRRGKGAARVREERSGNCTGVQIMGERADTRYFWAQRAK